MLDFFLGLISAILAVTIEIIFWGFLNKNSESLSLLLPVIVEEIIKFYFILFLIKNSKEKDLSSATRIALLFGLGFGGLEMLMKVMTNGFSLLLFPMLILPPLFLHLLTAWLSGLGALSIAKRRYGAFLIWIMLCFALHLWFNYWVLFSALWG